ncbi:MAG: hypothetical protein K0M66_04800 [Thiobacillus sp.]|nr:hypothetical protein [Thiobacillus sp.]
MSVWLELCFLTLQSCCLMPIQKVREFTLDDVVISLKGVCRASGAEGCRNRLANQEGPAYAVPVAQTKQRAAAGGGKEEWTAF